MFHHVEPRKPVVIKGGAKHDEGKARFDLLPPDSIWGLVRVFTIGAKKYADRNWEKGLLYGRVFGAMMRHAWKWWAGEEFDPEDGQHHLDSVMWCAAVLRHYRNNPPEFAKFDDRSTLPRPYPWEETEEKAA